MKNFILLVSFLFMTSSLWSQGLKAQGKIIVNSAGEEVILRGMGPGGWQIMEGYMMQTSGVAGSQHEIKEKLIELMGEANTETFFQKWRENHFTKRDVDSLAAWGFNSIRIPMHYNLFTLPIEDEPIAGENTWIETGFDHINDVLEWAEPHGIYVILDMHAAPGGQGAGSEINDYDPSKPSLWESQENRNKLVALWTRIAERYKNNEWIGGYDLINETHWDLGDQNALLREVFEDITEGIRSVDTNHILYIEGNSYANDHRGLTPPWDDNLVYSFHKYWSFNNENDLDWILPLREEHNVPLWMGESGENSNTWFTDAISLFEDNGIGWAWWTMRKIGDIDSPYAIDINPGYQKIIDYWKGEGPKPTEQETFDGMMQLTENLLVDNSSYRKDVPDAIIRQVQTDETVPYNGKATAIPGVVHMADFDLGKNNFAYSDTDVADYNLSTGDYQAWNKGWSYRNDGVDIEKNTDNVNSNGFHVGFVNKGEWIKYTVEIEETAVYKAKVRLATQENGGEFFLSIDGQEVTTNQVVSSTGGWSTFNTFEVSDIILTAGLHGLKLHFTNDIPFNISSIEFEKTGTVDVIPLKVLNGNTREDLKSVKITISESVLVSSLDGTLSNFTVEVNGEERSISAVSVDGSGDRSIVLTLNEYLFVGDQILVSYNGTLIKSESDKTLDVFSNLIINNIVSDIAVVPVKIEVEDYDYMVGMGLEDTEDEGGGKNFGYTDAGDYADYSILVPESNTYGIKFRIAGFSEGSIGLYSVDENSVETELVVVTTPVTNGWQTWETVADNLYIDEGIHKLRMRILSGGFNFNWMEFDYPDSDKDGVLDNVDNCPNTPEGAIVDVKGCEIFSLNTDNYSLLISSETCRSQNNGSIVLSALQNYNYTVELTGSNTSITDTFNSEISFDNLSADTYLVCMRLDSQPTYEQCFTVVVKEPQELSVSTSKNSDTSKVTLVLEGGETYFISLNEEIIVTKENEIELTLVKGINDVSVKTDKECQGIYTERFINNVEPLIYPNPVQNDFVFVNSIDFMNAQVPIEIYGVTGELVFSKMYNSNSGQIKIDLSSLSHGVFIMKIVIDNKIYNHKIIKQ